MMAKIEVHIEAAVHGVCSLELAKAQSLLEAYVKENMPIFREGLVDLQNTASAETMTTTAAMRVRGQGLAAATL